MRLLSMLVSRKLRLAELYVMPFERWIWKALRTVAHSVGTTQSAVSKHRQGKAMLFELDV